MADYNGWTNYATWRINLEYFSDHVHNLDDEERKELAIISTMKEINNMSMNQVDKWDKATDAHTALRESLREDIDTYIEEGTDDGIIAGWALSFLNDVNWVEIADSIITDARERLKD